MAIPCSIRAYRESDFAGLEAMYASFEPHGAARGLPPVREDSTERWLHYLDQAAHSLLACDETTGKIIGHAVLAGSAPHEAELAVFVHQDYRARGVGAALARAAVEYARQERYLRLWAAAAPSNTAAIRMVRSCGFRIISLPAAADTELELLLGD